MIYIADISIDNLQATPYFQNNDQGPLTEIVCSPAQDSDVANGCQLDEPPDPAKFSGCPLFSVRRYFPPENYLVVKIQIVLLEEGFHSITPDVKQAFNYAFALLVL